MEMKKQLTENNQCFSFARRFNLLGITQTQRTLNSQSDYYYYRFYKLIKVQKD